MQIIVMTEKEWNSIGESEDIEFLDTVLKGMISLLAISPSRLLSEAKKALDDVERFFSYDIEEIKTSLQQDVQDGSSTTKQVFIKIGTVQLHFSHKCLILALR